MTNFQILYVFIVVGCVFLLGVGAAVAYDEFLKRWETKHPDRTCRRCNKSEHIHKRERGKK